MNKKKHCPDCNQWLDSKFFGRNKNNEDGLAFYCKPCYNERRYASRDRTILTDVATLISEGIIHNTRLDRIGADLLLKSCHSRMNDEFPCMWNDRLDFARDLILKIEGFWESWIRLTEAHDKETNETEKHNLRPTIDRVLEHPSVGYRLENIQALSFLDNTLKTVKQSYDVINMTDNKTLTDKKKSEIIEAFSFSAEYLKSVVDSGMVEYEGKAYLFQSKDRTEGKHKEILEMLSDNSEGKYDMEFIINQPVVLVDDNGNAIKGTLTMPFKFDSRYVSAKVSDSPLSIEEAKNFKPTLKIIPKDSKGEAV